MNAYAFTTFQLLRPVRGDFWRSATCEEVDCERQRNGWRTVLDLDTADGRRLATWIVDKSGRHGSIERVGNVVTMTFAAGQRCFEKHRVPNMREPLYVKRDGNLAGLPRGGRRVVHASGADWVDDMQENLDKVRTQRERG